MLGERSLAKRPHITNPKGVIMKRRDFIKVTGLSVAGAASIAAPAIAQNSPELKWAPNSELA
jgi:hypothetical protein